jgi:acetyl esterase/lipase
MTDWTAARLVLDLGRGADVTRERRRFALPRQDVVDADIYRPGHVAPDALLPAVVFVHGDASPEVLEGVLDWGQYRSWGEAIASVDLAAVVFRHRSSEGLLRAAEVVEEIGDVLAYLRREGATIGVDGSRLAVWTCSAGSSFGATAALRAQPPVACLVSYYGFLDVRQIRDRLDPSIDDGALAAVSAAAVVPGAAAVPPTLIVKAALDRAEINDSIDAYVTAVAGRGPTQVLVHPTGHHAFDIVDDDATSADLIRTTITFLVAHLGPG